MKNSLSPKLSSAFQTANFFSTLLIIAVHCRSALNINGFTTSNSAFIFEEYVSNGFARIAVPFFAFASGIFFFLNYSGIDSYKTSLKKRIHTLLIPYCLASLLFYIYRTAISTYKGEHADFSIVNIIYEVIINPQSIQLWFLRDLIVLVLISPILHFLNKLLKELFILSVFIIWFFEVQPFPKAGDLYLISIDTFFFFSLGCYFSQKITEVEKILLINKSLLRILSFIWVGLITARIYLYPSFDIWYTQNCTTLTLLIYKLSIIIGIPILIAVSATIQSKKITFISSYTFFAYLFFLYPLDGILNKVCHAITVEQYFFYIKYPLTVLIVFSLAYMLDRYLNPVYKVLTGDRGLNKVQQRTMSVQS